MHYFLSIGGPDQHSKDKDYCKTWRAIDIEAKPFRRAPSLFPSKRASKGGFQLQTLITPPTDHDLDHLDPIDRIDHLDYLHHLDNLDHIDHIDHLDHIDPVKSVIMRYCAGSENREYRSRKHLRMHHMRVVRLPPGNTS